MLHVLVIYDISNDKDRRKVSDTCQDYGLDRYQYSVFVGILKPIHLRELAKVLRPHAETGQITVMTIGADEWTRRIQIGDSISGEQHSATRP